MYVAARWSIHRSRGFVPLVALTGAAALVFGLPSAEEKPDLEQLESPEEISYVRISGPELREQGGPCLPFLAGLTARATWSLQIASAASGCTGTWHRDTFEVHAGGAVTWEPPGRPQRTLQLTPTQLDRVVRLDRLSCTRMRDVGYGEAYFDVGIGVLGGTEPQHGGQYLSEDSPAGMELRAVLDEAMSEYADRRLAELGDYALTVAVVESWSVEWSPGKAPYRITLRDRGLHISRGAQELHVQEMSALEVVDFVDWAIATSAERAANTERGVAAEGTLRVGAQTHPIRLWKVELHGDTPPHFLLRAANDAPYLDGREVGDG